MITVRTGEALLTEFVERDLRDATSRAEAEILRLPENLVFWLQTLSALERQSETLTGLDKDRTEEQLAEHRDEHGHPADPTWRRLKLELSRREKVRLRYRLKIRERKAYVALLISREGLTPVTLGNVVSALAHLEEVLNADGLEAGLRVIDHLLDRYEREAEASREVNTLTCAG